MNSAQHKDRWIRTPLGMTLERWLGWNPSTALGAGLRSPPSAERKEIHYLIPALACRATGGRPGAGLYLLQRLKPVLDSLIMQA